MHDKACFNVSGFFQPTAFFLVAGAGDASHALIAFDRALLAAGVGDVNLVKLSSIVGPRCIRVEPLSLVPGSLVPAAYAWITCDQPRQRIASAVAVAHPADPSRASLVTEHSAVASKNEVEEIVIAMAEEGMVSRGLKVARIDSIGIEHTVERVGATFAGVVEV